ncbi:MAG: hypothetical protein H0W08_03650, partial [Acidobacteria bacterium]|nr:hypothetical protein [Acidobacteriota bacterium]
MNPSVIIAAIVGSLIAAVALLRRGWTGRVVDDHPICRACGFDLFNRPPDQIVCPECGVDLKSARAIRIGNRQRRQGLFYSGLTLLLVT